MTRATAFIMINGGFVPRGFINVHTLSKQMTIEMYPSDQVADLRAEVTHWYENLQKEQMNQQAQLQEFGQSGRQPGDFPGEVLQAAPIQVRSGISPQQTRADVFNRTQLLFTSTTAIQK